MTEKIYYQLHSFDNVGELTITATEKAVREVHFGHKVPLAGKCEQIPLLRETIRQLQEYFLGKRKRFNLPLDPQGTDFQKRIWAELEQIPYGETRSYGQIAVTAGCPRGCRAVGMANNRNPIAIIIPCHRVVGADGKLVGYAGGLERKSYLLALEQK